MAVATQPRFAEVPIERVEAFWDRQPCNSRHSPQPVGSRAYFEEIDARRYFVQPHILRFADFGRWAGKRVLEIGCGIGTDTMRFAHAGARVTAVDLSEASLRIARQRADVLGLADRVTFHHADAEQLDAVVPPAPYDLIYSFGVLHHTPRPERVIQLLRARYVHPGSELRLMVYHRHACKVLGILLAEGRGRWWRLDELVARHSEAQTGCPITYTYSRASVRDLLKGFRIDDLWVDHIFPWRVADYVHYRYRKVWYLRLLPAPVFRWLERRAGWHLCVTARPSGMTSHRPAVQPAMAGTA